MNRNKKHKELELFYTNATPAFKQWAPDLNEVGLYSMHIGYQDWQNPVENSLSTLQMSQEIIKASTIEEGQTILDAGCGVGSLAFAITNLYASTRVYGIDIAKSHILSATKHTSPTTFSSPKFSIQDYEQTSFPNEIFDRIIFCESYIHSQNKNNLIQESHRILKNHGKITISDIFMHSNELTTREINALEEVEEIMCIPMISHLNEIIETLFQNNFSNIHPVNITDHVVNPTEHDPNLEDINLENSLAHMEVLLIDLQNLMKSGKAGYYILTAQKTISLPNTQSLF